ncbi:type II secretion system F family protein [Nocardia thailandica]
MHWAMLCCAAALVALPVTGGRRRFAGVFLLPERRAGRWPRGYPLACGPAVAVLFVLGPGVGLAAALVAATVTVRVRRARRAGRRRTECGHLLTGLEAVVGELRVGAHPSAAAETAAAEATGETARVLAISAARSRLGGSGADGLLHPDSVVAEELSRIAAAWRVAEQHGLALAELLGTARADLRARLRFGDRTEAALAGARATAAVLAGLPLLGIGLGQLMGAAPVAVLFASAAGQFLLPLGAGLACCGLLWTDAITRSVR